MFEVDFGVRMVRAVENIRAITPDAAQCALLQVPAGTPLLSVERIAYTYNDVPMELRRGLYRTDSHHYRNDLN
jgi:GntR family transcriptional regulator